MQIKSVQIWILRKVGYSEQSDSKRKNGDKKILYAK